MGYRSANKFILRFLYSVCIVTMMLSAVACEALAPDSVNTPGLPAEGFQETTQSTNGVAGQEPPPLSGLAPQSTGGVSAPNIAPAPEAEPEPEPEPPPISNVKLAFTGDLMLHTQQANHAYNAQTREYDFNYSLSQIAPWLEADLTIGNLETVLGGPSVGNYGFQGYPLFSAPDTYAYALQNAGFDLLQTSNNHSLDQREAGLLRTLDVLDELGIAHFGTYRSQEERDTILIREVSGIRFAFLSYSYGTNGNPIPRGREYVVNIINEDLIRADIARAKEQNPDFIIVMPHMGREYETFARDEFRNKARMMLEAGADIVVSGHPHVVQPVEFMEITEEDGTVRQGFVAYCLGNFISGMQDPPNETGIILNMYFEKIGDEKATLQAISYVPFWVKRQNAARRADVVSLPLVPLLRSIEAGEDVDLRASDLTRVRNAHREMAMMMLGRDVPPEEMLDEYFILSSRESDPGASPGASPAP